MPPTPSRCEHLWTDEVDGKYCEKEAITFAARREGVSMAATTDSLAEAFTREHHEIDRGIEQYLDGVDLDTHQRAQSLITAMEALRRHIYLEEEIVFPHLPKGPLMMPLMVMYREHGELWRQIDQLSAVMADSSTSSGEAERCSKAILDLLDRHNSKEEPIIYPHMDADLSTEEQRKVRELLIGGSLPEGWVCRDA